MIPVYVFKPKDDVNIGDFHISVADKYCVMAATGACYVPESMVRQQLSVIREMYEKFGQHVTLIPRPSLWIDGRELDEREMMIFGIDQPSRGELEKALEQPAFY